MVVRRVNQGRPSKADWMISTQMDVYPGWAASVPLPLLDSVNGLSHALDRDTFCVADLLRPS